MWESWKIVWSRGDASQKACSDCELEFWPEWRSIHSAFSSGVWSLTFDIQVRTVWSRCQSIRGDGYRSNKSPCVDVLIPLPNVGPLLQTEVCDWANDDWSVTWLLYQNRRCFRLFWLVRWRWKANFKLNLKEMYFPVEFLFQRMQWVPH